MRVVGDPPPHVGGYSLATFRAGCEISGLKQFRLRCLANTPLKRAVTNRLTLDDAIRLALQDNPALRSAIGKVEAAGGRAAPAGLGTNPALKLSAADWPMSDGRGFSEAKQTVGVTPTLPFPGKKSLAAKIGGEGG